MSRNASSQGSTSTLVPLTFWETGPDYQHEQSPMDYGGAKHGVPMVLRVEGVEALPKGAVGDKSILPFPELLLRGQSQL